MATYCDFFGWRSKPCKKLEEAEERSVCRGSFRFKFMDWRAENSPQMVMPHQDI